MSFTTLTQPGSLRRQASGGFTLIEVIVALSVLAVGLTSLASYNHIALRNSVLAQQIQEASYFADRHLSELQLSNDIAVGQHSGLYQRLGGGFAYPWSLQVTVLALDPLQAELITYTDKVRPLQLTLQVVVDNGARTLEFHSLLLTPMLEMESPDTGLQAVQKGAWLLAQTYRLNGDSNAH